MQKTAANVRSALLVIDIQDSFLPGPRWERRSNLDFEKNVQRLIDGYRALGLPVLYFLDCDDTEYFEPSSPYFKLMDFVKPEKGEPVIVKSSRNCFTTTNLDYLLRRGDINRLAISGIKTEQCCETTTRVASDLGFQVDFVTEATLTFPIAHPDGGELSTGDIIERTEYALRDRFAKIQTIDSLLNELKG